MIFTQTSAMLNNMTMMDQVIICN